MKLDRGLTPPSSMASWFTRLTLSCNGTCEQRGLHIQFLHLNLIFPLSSLPPTNTDLLRWCKRIDGAMNKIALHPSFITGDHSCCLHHPVYQSQYSSSIQLFLRTPAAPTTVTKETYQPSTRPFSILLFHPPTMVFRTSKSYKNILFPTVELHPTIAKANQSYSCCLFTS